MARLNVSDLNFAYPGAPDPTLQNVNFEVKSGGSLALLGSSGAGMSTLLNLLSGLLPSMEGKIELDGVDVAGMAPAARGVAMMPGQMAFTRMPSSPSSRATVLVRWITAALATL